MALKSGRRRWSPGETQKKIRRHKTQGFSLEFDRQAGGDEKYPVFRGSFRQPLDAHRQSPSCFLARQEMNLPAMLPRHMKDGFVERG
jgi:hypothetical protein